MGWVGGRRYIFTYLGVLVLAIALQVLADRHRLLDEHVQVLGDFRGEEVFLQEAQDLAARHRLDLGDAVRVTQDHACMGRGERRVGGWVG